MFGHSGGVIYTVDSSEFVCGSELPMFRLRAHEFVHAHPNPIKILATTPVKNVLDALTRCPDVVEILELHDYVPPPLSVHEARLSRTIKALEHMQAGVVPWRVLTSKAPV